MHDGNIGCGCYFIEEIDTLLRGWSGFYFIYKLMLIITLYNENLIIKVLGIIYHNTGNNELFIKYLGFFYFNNLFQIGKKQIPVKYSWQIWKHTMVRML